jgi:ABC-type transport system substrate-binding protein
MGPIGQQGLRAPRRGRWLALVAAVLLALVLAMVLSPSGCQCAPARSKPWRHRTSTAIRPAAPSSEVLAEEAERARGLAERAHALRIHVDADPRHLDPLVAPTVWTERIAMDTVFESLLRYQAGADGPVYAPGLASSWTVSQGGQLVTLALRPDVRFHDGSRLTSVDVQFTLDAARSRATRAGHLGDFLAGVSSVELAGAHGVRIWLSRPNAYLLRGLAAIPILPAKVYQGQLKNRRGPVIGTGPYRFESWDGPVIRLVRNPDYWGPAPAIDTLSFVYEPDHARALTMAKGGEMDLVPALIPAHIGQASAAGVARRFVPVELGAPELDYLVLAVGQPPLDDVRVRRALSLAIDRQRLADDEKGLAAPVVSFAWPGGPLDAAAPAVPATDLAAAGRLLAEAGWIDRDGDGSRERGGRRLQLVALVGDEPDEGRTRVLKAIRSLGVFVEERVGSPAVLMNRLRSGDFQLAFLSYRGVMDDDLAPYFATGGAMNVGRFSDDEVDQLLAGLAAAWTPAERRPLAARLGLRLAELLPVVPLVRAAPRGLLSRRVIGATPFAGWLRLGDLSLGAEPE